MEKPLENRADAKQGPSLSPLLPTAMDAKGIPSPFQAAHTQEQWEWVRIVDWIEYFRRAFETDIMGNW